MSTKKKLTKKKAAKKKAAKKKAAKKKAAKKKAAKKKAAKKRAAKQTRAARPSGLPIRFDARVVSTRGRAILRLPKVASKQLPSRGQVAVEGTINGCPFQTVLEPDGEFGHWLRMVRELVKTASPGDMATVELQPTRVWPEPSVPRDLAEALSRASQEIRDLWDAITPMARWEWVRWVNATKNPNTRKRRVQVSISKLDSGKRRPCCFNLAACTDPHLSKSGKLVLEGANP